jgi:hypothetical protein
LVWACPTCNTFKRDWIEGLDPRTKVFVPLFNPRSDRWDDHFRWSKDGLRVHGRTAVGRATIRLLRMNRRGIRLLRQVQIDRGKHPAQQKDD